MCGVCVSIVTSKGNPYSGDGFRIAVGMTNSDGRIKILPEARHKIKYLDFCRSEIDKKLKVVPFTIPVLPKIIKKKGEKHEQSSKLQESGKVVQPKRLHK